MVYTSRRAFPHVSKKVGVNDHIIEEKKEMKKYGMKRRFYDHIPLIARDLPKDQ